MSKVSIAIIFGGVLLALWFATTFPKAEGQTAANTKDAWMVEKWTGSDAVYTADRLRITAEVKRARSPWPIVSRYMSTARQQPGNSLAAFDLAVAAFEAMCRPIRNEPDYVDIGKRALADTASPKNYEYARLRFLFESIANWPDPRLRLLGDRLLSIRKDDSQVLSSIGACYQGVDDKIAEAYLARAIALRPQDPFEYRTLGLVYVDSFIATQQPNDARQAISNLNKFVELLPGQSNVRDEALSYSSDMSKALKEQRSGGSK